MIGGCSEPKKLILKHFDLTQGNLDDAVPTNLAYSLCCTTAVRKGSILVHSTNSILGDYTALRLTSSPACVC